jgi:hypothetical protein
VAEKGGEWELYDLDADRIELNNLAKQQPGKLKEMLALYNLWAEKNWVTDWQKISAVLNGKQAGTVVLPDKSNPLRRTQEEVDQSVILINKERTIFKLPIMKDHSK